MIVHDVQRALVICLSTLFGYIWIISSNCQLKTKLFGKFYMCASEVISYWKKYTRGQVVSDALHGQRPKGRSWVLIGIWHWEFFVLSDLIRARSQLLNWRQWKICQKLACMQTKAGTSDQKHILERTNIWRNSSYSCTGCPKDDFWFQ